MKPTTMSKFTRGAVLGLLLAAGAAVCVSPEASGAVKWRTGVSPAVRPMGNAELRDTLSRELNAGATRRVVMHFDRPLTDADKAGLLAQGVRTLSYVGENAYFVTVTPRAVEVLDQSVRAGGAGLPSVRAAQPIMTAWKMHEDLNADVIQPWTIIDGKPADKITDEDRARDPIVAVSVLFHQDADMEREAPAAVTAAGGTIMGVVPGVGIMDVHLPYSHIKTLAAQDSVQWVEPPLPGLTELNANSRAKVGTNIVNAAPYNLSGAGVNVLVYDGGKVRATHVDFQGRVTIGPTDTSSTSDHSTHVAGTVGGAGVANANNRGMAPGVTIQSYGFEMAGGLVAGFLYTFPGDLQADYTAAVNAGAVIATNSIGTNTAPNGYDCTWEGNYGNTDVIIDSLVRGTPGISNGNPLRIVWANGNERQTTRCFDPLVPAGYHTTAPPSCAKNHITCGATDGTNVNTEPVASFTSWGPADDGRMKPDVSAPGVNTVSCSSSSDNAYATKSGTSMATPCVTGNSALLIQDFRANYPSLGEMRNSLLKCFLAHTAADLVNPGPDYQTGYGSIRIQPAVDLERSGNFGGGEVSQGGTAGFLVVVPPGNTQPLKITMAWDDVPGTPNVNPVLVNDLDLVVTSPSNVRAYPWTLPGLAGANTGNPAAQTQENHVDNIEQVYVANPQEGVWQVIVRGTTVPSGPQPFSITATPLLVNCSDAGVASLDRSVYPCGGPANLRVVDCGLNTSDEVVDTIVVNVASTSNPGGRMVTLTEFGAATADFRGSINLVAGFPGPSNLLVAHGDTVTLTYNDADSGGGSPAVVTSTATVDCIGPVISSVVATNIQPRSATVTFSTSEMATPKVRYGTSCGSLTSEVAGTTRGTSHSLNITGLQVNTTYYFSVEATDDAGNLATNNNGGNCFTFATPAVPDFFTELFTTNNDLDNRSFLFSPDGSISYYNLCQASPINSLPVDPAGGTTLTTGDDSPSATVTVTGGNTVKIYGQAFSSFFVNPNGNITFTASDSSLTESYATHFNRPRVSALFDDLNPTQAGTISYKQLSDRVTVTWLNVTEHNGGNQNTFQISLFFDGRIELAYLSIAAVDGLVGLSGSTAINPDFSASDMSGYGSCGPRPPFALGASHTTAKNNGKNIVLGAGDDGLPAPPAALTYTLLTLPANGVLKDLVANTDITSAPAVLSSPSVRYKPLPGFTGSDSFTFKVNDGGTPPDGGDSNTATVSFTVTNTGSGLPFADQFPSNTGFDNTNWITVSNATIDDVGIAEPSPLYSARFNGNPSGADSIVSRVLDLLPYSGLRVKYQFECRGGGESPDSGDNLYIDYLDNNGTWQNLSTHLGTLPDAVVYTPVDLPLPANAKHGNFQLRVRCTATAGAFDDWFVDDVEITGSYCPGDANGDGVINTADLTALLGNFGDIAAGWGGGDFNGDGYVNTADLTELLGVFGQSCP